MTIAELLDVLRPVATLPLVADHVGRTPASGVVHDSRKAAPGTVFVAVRGQHADGSTFALKPWPRRGGRRRGGGPLPGRDGPGVQVADARLALALLADRASVIPAATSRSSASPARTERPPPRTCCARYSKQPVTGAV